MPRGKYERTPEIREKMRRAQTGKKASPETREKMRQSHLGLFTREKHPLWTGDAGSKVAGNKRAIKLFPDPKPCEMCGASPDEASMNRHHIDENTLNNDPANLQWLCDACHIKVHREAMVAARWGEKKNANPRA